MHDEAGGGGKVLLQSNVAVHDAGEKNKEAGNDCDGVAEEGMDAVVALDFRAPRDEKGYAERWLGLMLYQGLLA